jgi:hypothetical protein
MSTVKLGLVRSLRTFDSMIYDLVMVLASSNMDFEHHTSQDMLAA